MVHLETIIFYFLFYMKRVLQFFFVIQSTVILRSIAQKPIKTYTTKYMLEDD